MENHHFDVDSIFTVQKLESADELSTVLSPFDGEIFFILGDMDIVIHSSSFNGYQEDNTSDNTLIPDGGYVGYGGGIGDDNQCPAGPYFDKDHSLPDDINMQNQDLAVFGTGKDDDIEKPKESSV